MRGSPWHLLDSSAHRDDGAVLVGLYVDVIHAFLHDRRTSPSVLTARWSPSPDVGDHRQYIGSVELEVYGYCPTARSVGVFDRVCSCLSEGEQDVVGVVARDTGVDEPSTQRAANVRQRRRHG